MTVNDKLESIWKEAIKAFLKAISQHLPGGLKKTTKNSVRTVGVQTENQT